MEDALEETPLFHCKFFSGLLEQNPLEPIRLSSYWGTSTTPTSAGKATQQPAGNPAGS